mmetsp:Transcript_3346/g.4781  ORF Transcript_3346/g.4781 Transcript_3346/m.4781 type:complete len:88 (+) Transcript_3346:48-311(+)
MWHGPLISATMPSHGCDRCEACVKCVSSHVKCVTCLMHGCHMPHACMHMYDASTWEIQSLLFDIYELTEHIFERDIPNSCGTSVWHT